MNATFEEIVISAYLHDVGKFAQRADKQELYSKNLEGQFCKKHKEGWYSHQHVLFTNGFLEKHKDVLPDGVNASNIIQLASAHHNPSSPEEWIIAEADRLSSGSDRCNILGVAAESENEDESKLKFYEKPMIHLLSTLKIGNNKLPVQGYYKLEPLDKDNILVTSDSKISKEQYSKLWDKFEADFEELKDLTFDSFIQSLNTLIERYWWCIPSATNSDADISLYQHSKTTAAFAAALYRYHEKENNLKIETINNSELKKYLFVSGDISGIQKYIFDLKTSEDSAKLLRAKSFQLMALSKVLSEYICKKFNVCEANVITSAAGKFLVLLPNTEGSEQLISDIQTQIETYFLKEFAGKLNIVISDGIQTSGSELQHKNAQSLFNRIGTENDKAKQQKMQKALRKNGPVLEEFYDNLQKYGECPKCGMFASNPLNEDKECDNCKKLTEIGRKLLKGSVVKLDSSELKHFGQMVNVYRKDEISGKNFFRINNYTAGQPLMYLPYTAPMDDIDTGVVKSFKEIADDAEGNNKLAMFKADIDSLGLIFATSLGERISISRYADLSFMLHYFFSAFYTWFVKNKSTPEGKSYEDCIYTVFSGGDDLCVIGEWNSILYFARDFHNELLKFTGNNPSITISAGINLYSAGTPVNIAADMTEENLEKSKGHQENGVLKNAITIFNATVDWNTYSECLKDGIWIEGLLDNGDISTGIIYKMLDFSRRAECVHNGNVRDLLDMRNRTWKSNFHYVVARNVKNETIKNKLLAFAADDKKMINSRISVSYALYKQRNNKEE